MLGRCKGYTVNEAGDLVISVIGIPYGGPLNGKDLHGEYFTPNTDLGPLEKGLSYFDHTKLAEEAPEHADFFDNPIGMAERVGPTEEGEMFNIIIDRRYKYLNFIKKLVENDVVGVSSTPYQRSVKISPDGEIKRWHWVELGLTQSPANPYARIVYKSIEGNLDMEVENNMPVELEVEAPETPSAPAAEVSEEPSVTIVDVLMSMRDQLAAVSEMLKSISDSQISFETRIKAVEVAIPALGEDIAKSLRVDVAAMQKRSTTEQAILEKRISKPFPVPQFPDTAPGRERRAQMLQPR